MKQEVLHLSRHVGILRDTFDNTLYEMFTFIFRTKWH